VHVEVKGVQGDEPSFFLTGGEVRRAENDPAWVLAVVTSALSPARRVTSYSGREFLASFALRPTQFQAMLTAPLEGGIPGI
jgi:hypothetical protein